MVTGVLRALLARPPLNMLNETSTFDESISMEVGIIMRSLNELQHLSMILINRGILRGIV